MAHNATGTWAVPIAETFDGVRRDVVGVRCGTEALSRAQTLAACESTEGTFFYDPEMPGQAARWDDGVTAWDSSAKWDQDPIVYVHRLGGRPPTEVDVLAQVGIFWGSHGVWQPSMSAMLLTDGGLEVWASPTDLTYWAEYTVGAGGGAVNRDATDRAVETYSARIDGSLNAAGGKGIYQVGISAVGGATYRFSGYYRTAEDNPADFEAMLNLGVTGYYLNVDGRTTNAPGAGFALARTNGYWRRFAFDFVCPADTTGFEILAYAWNAAGGAQSGSVWFDDLALQRIHRFEFYEPRLTAEGVPSVDQGRPNASAWWNPMQTALGQLSVTNANGLLEQLFAAYDWIGAEVILRVGGKFSDGGNEILADDHFTAFIGKTDAPRIGDLSASLSLTDARVTFQQTVPRHRYDDGSPKPIVFGLTVGNQTIALQFSPPTYLLQQGIVPRLVGVGANGYGVYEVVDPSDSPYGLATFGAVNGTFFSYLDDAAASNGAGWSHYPLSLSPVDGGGPEYAFDIVTGRLTILRDVQVVQITSENNYVDFDVGGGALAAMLVPDTIFGQVSQKGMLRCVGTLWLAQAMTAVAGAAIFITYDEITHKYTVSKASGTLNLLCKTGANASISMWPLLGFDCSTDKTGSLGYTAENPVYRSTEQHIIRAGITGYADDAAGTFTGTAGPEGIVEQPADCLHFILRILAGVSADRVNAASFITARAAGPTYSGVFVGEEISIGELDLVVRSDDRRRSPARRRDLLPARPRFLRALGRAGASGSRLPLLRGSLRPAGLRAQGATSLQLQRGERRALGARGTCPHGGGEVRGMRADRDPDSPLHRHEPLPGPGSPPGYRSRGGREETPLRRHGDGPSAHPAGRREGDADAHEGAEHDGGVERGPLPDRGEARFLDELDERAGVDRGGVR